MINDETQLEIRKFLKKLGINSHKQLNDLIENNQSLEELNISVNVSVNNNNLFNFEEKIIVSK